MVCRKHSGLPNLALFNFTVAQHSINTVSLSVHFSRFCDSTGGGNSLPQGSRAHVDARRSLHIRVALQHCADVTQLLELVRAEIAALRQGCV